MRSLNLVLYLFLTFKISKSFYFDYEAQDIIWDGETATLGQFRYMVSIQNLNPRIHQCGGSIIDARWIITAAHCLQGGSYRPNLFEIEAGMVTLFTGTFYSVSRIVKHEKYGIAKEPIFDIALMQIKDSFDFKNPNIGYIKLYNSDHYRFNASVTGLGWGLNQWNQYSMNLQYTDDLYLDKCKNLLYIGYEDALVCVSYKPNKAMCEGDSGGPVVYERKVMGVLAWGPGPCNKKIQMAFSSAFYHKEWVLKQIKKPQIYA